MNVNEQIKPEGTIERIVDYLDGRKEITTFNNTILRNGRIALAKSLANEVDDTYDFYISQMIFGTNGTSGGVQKFVAASRTGLFGVTELSKAIIASRDETQVIFTSVISFTEANSAVLNEMALRMHNGQLYSMVTFPDLTKTNQMQITFNWRISMV